MKRSSKKILSWKIVFLRKNDHDKRKHPDKLSGCFLAGGVRIELTRTVLETVVLPLYEPPECKNILPEFVKKIKASGLDLIATLFMLYDLY